jgi:hypothetical protein
MDLHAIRSRCASLLATLELSNPFDLTDFCDKLGGKLGCSIGLIARRMPAEVPGCSIWLDDRLLIVYEEDTSVFHQKYIIFHEIGHALFRHNLLQTLQVIPLAIAVDAEAIRTSLPRSGYLTQHEQEAEVFASLLLQRVATTPIAPTRYRAGDRRIERLEDFIAGLV